MDQENDMYILNAKEKETDCKAQFEAIVSYLLVLPHFDNIRQRAQISWQ